MFYYHEQLHRNPGTMERLRAAAVTICGAGALGANIAESLARTGLVRLRMIDRDRIEERNLSTQPYSRADIGGFKAKILANNLYRAVGTEGVAVATELHADNALKLLEGSDLVIDAFDNSISRRIVADSCSMAGIPCLHAGVAAGYAEVIWNDTYRIPSNAQDDICDYPLARNLVMLAVAVACESAIGCIATGSRKSYTITLEDLAVREYASLGPQPCRQS